MRYDVVVAGAGVAGLFAAYRLAKTGFSVAVLDMKSEDKVGEKVCGDAIGEHHFLEVGLEPPRVGVDAIYEFQGVRVYSPSRKAYVTVHGKGYALDRKAFGQRLLRLAVNAGAEFLGSRHVVKPIIDGSWVRGVVTRGPSGVEEYEGKAVIDATGAMAVVRTRCPSEWWVSEKPPLEDFNATYRVVARVEEPQDPRYALIFLNPEIAPGGYWWWFPKGEHVVNVGLGVRPGPGAPNPKANFEKYIVPELELAKATVLHEGGGMVPTRRIISCMVWNGLLAVGDAACTANPIHGGGIGSALVSSYHATEVLSRALERGEPSIEALWPYHHAYLSAYGIKQAGLDVLRIFLQSLTTEDLDFVLEKGIVTDEDLSIMGYEGDISSMLIRRLLSGVKLLARPSLLKEILAVKSYMDKAKKLYQEFPRKPDEFLQWRERQERLFAELKRRFWGRG